MLRKIVLFFIVLCSLTSMGFAQLQITYPTTRIVFQRNQNNQSTFTIAGNYSVCIDKVEARLSPMVVGQGTAIDWTIIQMNPTGGFFGGQLTATGGWYLLEVRASLNGVVVANTSVQRVGIGEVFIIAGQSNAGGLDQPDVQGASDDRVSCVNYYNVTNTQNDPPIPVYSHLDAYSTPSMRGENAWSWGYLGDYLVTRLNVPVMIFNAGWGSTSSENWRVGANDPNAETYSIYTAMPFPKGMPYVNLRTILNYYVPQTGIRGILWQQGENDAHLASANSATNTYITKEEYVGNMQSVIAKTRQHSGKNISWAIARSTLHNFTSTSQLIIDAQNQLIATTTNVFAGPNTDFIQNPRPDGDHFSGIGHQQHAQAWSLALDNVFFANSVPHTPMPIPLPTVSCGTGNNLNISLSNGYASYLWSNGMNAATVSLGAGTYTAKVKDTTGNTILVPAIVVPNSVLPTSPTIVSDGTTTICAGSSVNLSLTNNSSACSFVWNNNATTSSIKVNLPGSFFATVKNAYGCVANSNAITIVNFPIAPPAAPTISGTSDICQGGSVTLQSSFAGRNIWNTTAEGTSINVSVANSYTVRAVDANGCSSAPSAPFTVTIKALPKKPIIISDGSISFCVGNKINLSSDYATGLKWSTNETTPSIAVSASGKFAVYYTDATTGCVSPTSDTIKVTANTLPAAPVITAGGVTTFCLGDAVNLSSSQAFSYFWNTGERTQTIKASNEGPYSLYIVDINGCKSSTSAPINISLYPLPAMPSITAVGLASVCQGNTVTLQSSFAGKNIWSNAVEGNSINVGVANNYTVRAVDANGCKSNASLPFYVDIKALPNKPTITADGATTFCLGNKVTLSSNYAAGIKWNTNETIQSLVVSASGKFSLIYTDPNTGCTSLPADTVKVIVNALPIAPIITAGGATSFCLGQDVSLSSSQAPAYFWNTGARTQTIKISSASTYSLYIVDANGCKSPASLPTTITVYPLPNAPVIVAESETTFCPDKSVVLSSNTVGTSYLWSSGETTKAITINKSGTYTAKVSDQNGCLSYASNALVINVLPIPAIPVITPSGPTSFCQGGSVVLKSSNAKLYSWSTGETTQSLSINQSGAFYLRTTDANGCLSAQSATINVVVNPLPLKPSILAESATTFCLGESVILTTPIQSQYFWTNGATTQKTKITTTGKYAVKITDANGCASPLSDSISIIVNPLPTTPTIVADGATTFCADKGLMLSSSIDKNYRWSNGNATQQITVNVAGSYFVQTINAYGCMSLPSNIITTTTKPVPAAPVISPDGSLFFCDGASVKLCATPNTQIKWATGEEIACLSVTKAGDYYATYTGDNGCVSLPSNIITVNPQVLPSTPAIKQIGAYILEAQGAITGEAYRWELNKQLLLQNSASFKVNTEGVYQVQTQITYKLGTATLTCYSKASDPYTFKYYEFDKGIVLYPNPNTSGIFYVETKENLTNAVVVVYSMIGQEIGRYNIALFDDRKMIDLHTLPVGNYLVRVTNSSFDYTRMVMIVR